MGKQVAWVLFVRLLLRDGGQDGGLLATQDRSKNRSGSEVCAILAPSLGSMANQTFSIFDSQIIDVFDEF